MTTSTHDARERFDAGQQCPRRECGFRKRVSPLGRMATFATVPNVAVIREGPTLMHVSEVLWYEPTR
jgi:hypothetical protein